MSQKNESVVNLLLVDDDLHLLESMGGWLSSCGYGVCMANGCQQALEALSEHRFDLAIVDVRLADGDGFEILSQCRVAHPGMAVILMTGYGTADTGVEALRAGAFDLVTKPVIDEELAMAIDRALSQRQVMQENKLLKAQLDQRFGMDNIVGSDPRMQKTFEIIESVADTPRDGDDHR